jgi:hypothetical protein
LPKGAWRKRNPYARRHCKAAYRSGLEDKIASQIQDAGHTLRYETRKIDYTVPAKQRKYTPDFILDNGVIVESKGMFVADDRAKHLLIKEQYPDADVRFVFSNSRAKLYKGSKSTYASWCEKNGFKYADKVIPRDWFLEESDFSGLDSLGLTL